MTTELARSAGARATLAKLLREADEIIGMAEGLAARGLVAEAVVFAAAAAQWLQLARAFQTMAEAGA